MLFAAGFFFTRPVAAQSGLHKYQRDREVPHALCYQARQNGELMTVAHHGAGKTIVRVCWQRKHLESSHHEKGKDRMREGRKS